MQSGCGLDMVWMRSVLMQSGCGLNVVYMRYLGNLDAIWMQSGCDVDAIWMQSGCGLDAVFRQSGCNLDAKSICFYLFFCGFGVDGIVRRANLFIYFTVKVLS